MGGRTEPEGGIILKGEGKYIIYRVLGNSPSGKSAVKKGNGTNREKPNCGVR